MVQWVPGEALEVLLLPPSVVSFPSPHLCSVFWGLADASFNQQLLFLQQRNSTLCLLEALTCPVMPMNSFLLPFTKCVGEKDVFY